MAAILAMSCEKDVRTSLPGAGEAHAPISFKVEGLDVDFSTKVTAVTDLASFNVLATTGTTGSESYAWTTVATKSGDSYITDKYWPNGNLSYHFYASNASLTFAPAGATVTVDGSTDVVCAYKSNPALNTQAVLTFNHILTRLGTVTATCPDGYTLTVSSIGIKKLKTTGTCNLRTKGWTGTNEVQMQAVQVGNNDLYFIPGQYDVSVTFTMVKGDFSGTYTSVGSVTFPAEKLCNLTLNITKDPAVPVSFSVTVLDWEARSIPVTLT